MGDACLSFASPLARYVSCAGILMHGGGENPSTWAQRVHGSNNGVSRPITCNVSILAENLRLPPYASAADGRGTFGARPSECIAIGAANHAWMGALRSTRAQCTGTPSALAKAAYPFCSRAPRIAVATSRLPSGER